VLGRSVPISTPTSAQMILWLLGAVFSVVAVMALFAILLRPFRVIVIAFIVLMAIWFIAILGSGALDRVFGVGGWLMENSAAWGYLFWRCRAVIIGMLVVSLLYRWIEDVIERRKAA